MRIQTSIDTDQHNEFSQHAEGQPGPAITASGHPTPVGATAKPKLQKQRRVETDSADQRPTDKTHL